MEGTSLFVFSIENVVRRYIYLIVNKNWFDYVILVAIMISTIQLAIESPLLDPESSLAMVLVFVDIVMTTIFVIEALAKIIAFGFLINGKDSYLRSPWNVMDLIIVIFSIVSLSSQGSEYLKALKAIRLLRVLRPLRVIARNEGLKIAVSSLFLAGSDILNMTLITILFFLIFGIIGVNLFKGTYYKCSGQLPEFEIDTKWDCLSAGGTWA